MKICADQPPPLSSLVPHVPKGLVAIVERAMAKEAGARFGSAAELRDALLAYVGGDTVPLVSGKQWVDSATFTLRSRPRWPQVLVASLVVVTAAVLLRSSVPHNRRREAVLSDAAIALRSPVGSPVVDSAEQRPSVLPAALSSIKPAAKAPAARAKLPSNRQQRRARVGSTRAPSADTLVPAHVSPLIPPAAWYRTRGFRLRDVADYPAAVASLKTAFAMDSDAELLYEIAYTEELAGRHAEALKHLRHYLSLAPFGTHSTEANSKLAKAKPALEAGAPP